MPTRRTPHTPNPKRVSRTLPPSKRRSQTPIRPTRRSTPQAKARKNALNSHMFTVSTQGGDVAVTRRTFLIGAAGAAVVVAAGVGGKAIADSVAANKTSDFNVLEVPSSAVTASDSGALSQVDASACMSLVGSYELTYGTQVWTSGNEIAACLVPGETAKPLCTVSVLWLQSGITQTVLEGAVGQAEGFNIFDVRATTAGLVWVESDILEGIWRIYSATLESGGIGQPALMDEGDSEWETPTIAAVGNRAFWQVLPNLDGSHATEPSLLKACAMGSSEAEIAWKSIGRMSTPPYATADSVVITPRLDTSGVYHQLTCIDAESLETVDTLVLPQSMKPLETGYGKTGFMFSFDGIYNYGDGISQLGTYVPAQKAEGDEHSAVPWFRFSRTPTAAPAWCGSYFLVKSDSAVSCIDLASNTYCSLGVESGADDYGDYLASSGTGDIAVTFSNIDAHPIGGEAKKCCLVRVWAPL